MNAERLVALCTELCDNVRDGLLSPASAADAIASAATTYEPEPRPVLTREQADASYAWADEFMRDHVRAPEPEPDIYAYQKLYHEARGWIADCFSDVDVAELSDAEVRDGIQRHYIGGWAAFVTASGTAYGPVITPNPGSR